MTNETTKTLSAFAQKAMQRLQDKKVVKHQKLYIPSLDQEIKIRNLSYTEVVECTETESGDDENTVDKYSIYLGVVEPNLKETATELKANGEITQYLDVVDIFEMSEISEIATEIMKLSGVISSKKVTIVEELKN